MVLLQYPMRYLIVAATEAEIVPMKEQMRFYSTEIALLSYEIAGKTVDVLITGVGMTATAAHVSRVLSLKKYTGVINAGIAGTFDRSIALGEVVVVATDCVADLGAEDGNSFLSAGEIGLLKDNDAPYTDGKLHAIGLETFGNLSTLRRCDGISVNRVHGNEPSIAQVEARLHPQVESMEGAGFYYACALFNQPCIQVRAISNYVERRNRAAWKIGEAVKNLNATILDFLRT